MEKHSEIRLKTSTAYRQKTQKRFLATVSFVLLAAAAVLLLTGVRWLIRYYPVLTPESFKMIAENPFQENREFEYILRLLLTTVFPSAMSVIILSLICSAARNTAHYFGFVCAGIAVSAAGIAGSFILFYTHYGFIELIFL